MKIDLILDEIKVGIRYFKENFDSEKFDSVTTNYAEFNLESNLELLEKYLKKIQKENEDLKLEVIVKNNTIKLLEELHKSDKLDYLKKENELLEKLIKLSNGKERILEVLGNEEK